VREANLDHPFRILGSGRTATAGSDDHIRDMVEQVLFTSPGERVNRPDFGCGLRQQVFAANSDALATVTQLLVHGSLQRWLGDVIEVRDVRIVNDGERLSVEVVYRRVDTGDSQRATFSMEVPG
jgi:phage baseplate assembly protein W